MKALWGPAFAVSLLAIERAALAVCVPHDNTAALQQALAGAAAGTDTTVRVEHGTYAIGAWLYHLPPSRDVALLGGYKPGTNCDEAQRHVTASGSDLQGRVLSYRQA